MEYTVKITDYASVQLQEIFQYIKYSLQAPETALQLLDLLEKNQFAFAISKQNSAYAGRAVAQLRNT